MTKPHLYDSSEKPYISNPINLVIASFESFKIMALEYLKLLGISLLGLLGISILGLLGLFSVKENGASVAAVGLIALWFALLFAGLVYIGYAMTMMTLAAARGVRMNWKDSLPKEYRPVLGLLWTGILTGFVVFLGFVLFIVPGIFFMLWYSQSVLIAADQRIYGLKALVMSKDMVRKRLMDMAGAYGLSNMVQLASNIPLLGSGLVFVYSVVTVPQASVRYVQLKNLSDEDRSTTPTNRWNYVFFWTPIVLGLLFLLVFFGASLLGLPTLGNK